ncbi:mucin-2-like isoform X2 [Haliotis rufescens]|uniref:mucin-2-like isoform X2 n=1 Tax=Haliotis rufescens TaxID=6454 RepID=UPI001EB0358E|nr:mucin-2-like isoform X2 [Haliotis rufescens]
MRHILAILIGSWSVLCSVLAITPTKGAGVCKTELSVDGIQGDVLHDLCSLTSTPGVSLVLTCKDQESFKCLQPIDPIVLDVCQEENKLSKVVAISMSSSKQHGGSLSVELSLVVHDDDVAEVLDVFQVHSSLQSTSEGVTRLEAIGRDRQTRIQIALHRTCISPSMMVLDRSRRENKLGNGPVQISITDRLSSSSAREESIFSGEGEQWTSSLDDLVKDSLHRLQERMTDAMNSVSSSIATASDTPGSTSVQTETETQATTPSTSPTSTEYATMSKTQTVSDATTTSTPYTTTETTRVSSAPPTKKTAEVERDIEPKPVNRKPGLMEDEEFKWAADEQEPRVIKQINDQDFLDQLLDSLRDGANVNPVRGPPTPLSFSKPHVPTTTLSTTTTVPPPVPTRTTPGVSSSVKTPSARGVDFNPWSEIINPKSTNGTDGSPSDEKVKLNIGVGDGETNDDLNPLVGVPTGKPVVNADDAATSSITLPRPSPTTASTTSTTATTSATTTPDLTSSGLQETFSSKTTDSTTRAGTTNRFVPDNPPIARVTKQAPKEEISPRTPDTTTVVSTSTASTPAGETVSPVTTSNNKLRELKLIDTTTDSGNTRNDVIRAGTTTDKSIGTTQTPTSTTLEASSSSSSSTTRTTTTPTTTPTTTTITTTEATTAKKSATTSTTRSTTPTPSTTATTTTTTTINPSPSTRNNKPNPPSTATATTTSTTPTTTTINVTKTSPALKATTPVSPGINSSSTSTQAPPSTTTVITTPFEDLSSGHTPGPLLATSSESKAGGLSVSVSGDPENDDTFWPVVAALVIGIPSIIVFGIAITVIHKRRLGHPTRFRSQSTYPSL